MGMTATIALIDADKSRAQTLGSALQSLGCNVSCANRRFEAMDMLQLQHVDIIVMTPSLPDGHWSDIRTNHEHTPFILLCEADESHAEQALAHINILEDPNIIAQQVLQALKPKDKPSDDHPALAHVIANSDIMQSVINMALRAAKTKSSILITGATGTGKEVMAQLIHAQSNRADKPFVAINCGAIPEELLESELFGHSKGAFTGATHSRKGRFQVANKGTIFLDEIGDMSPKLQVKLLRVLQERCFEPVGSHESIDIDVRIIAATHRDLAASIEDGRFREDLYYRLNVIPLELPSLRARGHDILDLAQFFMHQLNQSMGTHVQGMDAETKSIFLNYPWPGNVRELSNIMERIAVLKGEGIIGKHDLPSKMVNAHDAPPPAALFPFHDEPSSIAEQLDMKKLVEDFENQLILSALDKFEGNKKQAADYLGMKRTTLVEKLKKRQLAI